MGLHDCSAGKKSERRGEERSGAERSGGSD